MNLKEIFDKDLRGKDYIAARGLSPEIVKDSHHVYPECLKAEMLPAVQRILLSFSKQGSTNEERNCNGAVGYNGKPFGSTGANGYFV